VHLNWLDDLLILILGFSMARSFGRGLSREVISLVAAIAALVLAMWFYGTAGAMTRTWVGSARAANFLGFLLVFFGVILAGMAIGRVIRSLVKAVGLSFFDRMAGAGFGLLRGTLIAIALLTAYIAFGPRSDEGDAPSAVVHSQIAPYLMKASSIFVDAAPMELKRSFRDMYDEVQASIRNMAQPDTTNAGAGNDPGKR
jgi:membrane protein required for colicin V production